MSNSKSKLSLVIFFVLFATIFNVNAEPTYYRISVIPSAGSIFSDEATSSLATCTPENVVDYSSYDNTAYIKKTYSKSDKVIPGTYRTGHRTRISLLNCNKIDVVQRVEVRIDTEIFEEVKSKDFKIRAPDSVRDTSLKQSRDLGFYSKQTPIVRKEVFKKTLDVPVDGRKVELFIIDNEPFHISVKRL